MGEFTKLRRIRCIALLFARWHYKIEAKSRHAGTIGKFDHYCLWTISTDTWLGIQRIDFSVCKFHDKAISASCRIGQQGRSLSDAKRKTWK